VLVVTDLLFLTSAAPHAAEHHTTRRPSHRDEQSFCSARRDRLGFSGLGFGGGGLSIILSPVSTLALSALQ